MNSILFSIITVTYNNSKGLVKTIESISQQNEALYEHIVIDGDSKDETKTYLKSFNKDYLNWISEPDKGIYDAMNKGMKLMKGKWAIFMNAGDTFSDKSVLKKFTEQNFSSDIVYGNCYVEYASGLNRISKPNNIEDLWRGMSFSHQSVFIKKDIIENNEFDLSYNYCADFNQLFGMYLSGSKFEYWDCLIANIEAGGISDAKRYISTNEVYQVNKKLSPKLMNHVYFIPKIFWSFVIVKIKTILPKKVVNKLIQIKYK